MTSAPPIGFEYRPSRWLLLALALMLVLAVLSIIAAALPSWLQALLIVLAVGGGGMAFFRLLRPRVRALLWRADGGVQLDLHARGAEPRRELAGRLNAAHVSGPLITLRLRWSGRGRETLWLLPDNLGADTRRRLRVRLRAESL